MNSGQNYYSDYGSGSSSNSSSSWPAQDVWSSHQTQRSLDRPVEKKSTSYHDLVTGKCTLEDIMKEFQMNGLDTPYTPVEDRIWSNHAEPLSGMGPASAYVRQRSWPAPERSPAQRLPRPHSSWLPDPTAQEFNPHEFTTSTPVEEMSAAAAPTQPAPALSVEQKRVLRSLPDSVLTALLHELEARGDLQKRTNKISSECRFCKNNGERESYYRSHSLKDGAGRVVCPVLRAFVCKRCGAHGDSAHTSKYCPLSTADERMKSTAMMRSVRMASGRRRASSLAPADDQYMVFGQRPPSIISDTNAYNSYTASPPLDPLWAALEQKLLL